jgi:uridine nucleosidase
MAAVLTGTPDEIVFYDWDGVKSQGTKHNERFDVTVVTEGTAEEAQRGEKQTGRTIANVLPAGEEGVRIPRGVDVDQFWKVIEECIERADETNRKLSN